MVLLLWHRPNIFRHVDFMSCHGFSALGTRPLLGPPIPKRLEWFRLTDQKLGNVFDAKRKNGDGLGLSPNACVGGYLGLRPSLQSMSNILNLFPGFSLFLPGNEVMGFSEPNLWYTLVAYHLHGQTGQCHLPENGRKRPETCIKEWNTNFRLQYSSRKNRGFSDVPLLPEIFSWVDRKSRVLFTFQPDFPENCCKW